MIQAFYSAALGAQQQMTRMGVQGNNISNVNTYGYKAEKPSFEAALYRYEDGVDGAQLPRGSGALMVSTATDFASSSIEQTGRSLDYTIVGDGFFALRDPATGEVSYTRDGSFTLSRFLVNGQETFYLSDGEGRQVLDGNGNPIVVTDQEEKQPIGVYTFQYQDGLQHLDAGRFAAQPKNGVITSVAAPELQQGYLETSNTDLAYEIGKVIEAQRSYSYALRMVTTADEVETTINGLTNG